MIFALLLAAAVATSTQPDLPPGPVAAAPFVLRAGTPVAMQSSVGLSSLTNREGDRFDLVVVEDVVVGGYAVIKRGSRGIGEISKLVPKGAFGKSGKLELRLLFVEVGGARIRLDGRAAQRGHSGTAGTVVTAVLAGTFAAFVTGSSATIPAASPMTGFIERDLPILLQPAAPN